MTDRKRLLCTAVRGGKQPPMDEVAGSDGSCCCFVGKAENAPTMGHAGGTVRDRMPGQMLF